MKVPCQHRDRRDSLSPVFLISLTGAMNPVPPVGGNSRQYEYRIFRVPRVQSSEPPLAISRREKQPIRMNRASGSAGRTEQLGRRTNGVLATVHALNGVGTDRGFLFLNDAEEKKDDRSTSLLSFLTRIAKLGGSAAV